jgi:hypothetical protein
MSSQEQVKRVREVPRVISRRRRERQLSAARQKRASDRRKAGHVLVSIELTKAQVEALRPDWLAPGAEPTKQNVSEALQKLFSELASTAPKSE